MAECSSTRTQGVRRSAGTGVVTWTVLAGLTAFAVGSLFRLKAATGQGLFGMFGTLGIVCLGYFATQVIRSYSMSVAIREYNDALDRLPPSFALFCQVFLPELASRPKGVAAAAEPQSERQNFTPLDAYVGPANYEEVIIHPRAIFIPVLDHTDNQPAFARVKGRLERTAERARRRALVLRDRLRAFTGSDVALPIVGVMVLTRRRVDEEFDPVGVQVTTVEDFVQGLEAAVDKLDLPLAADDYRDAHAFIADHALTVGG